MIKGSRRTFLCLSHTSGYNQPSLDVLFVAIFHMAFLPWRSPHVRPRHIRVTFSPYRDDRSLLRGVLEPNGPPSLRSHLRRDQLGSVRLRRVRIVMPRAEVSNPTYHVNPPPHPAG